MVSNSLCGCSWPITDDPPISPVDPTLISKSRLLNGSTSCVESLASRDDSSEFTLEGDIYDGCELEVLH